MNNTLLKQWIGILSGNKQRVAFPEATEEKILKAARDAMDMGAIDAVLVGNPDEIKKAAEEYGVNITNMQIEDVTDENRRNANAEEYAAGHFNLSASAVKRKCKDAMMYAFVLQEIGKCDCVFAGLTHTTGEVILAAQMFIGMKEGISTVSSVGIMDIPGYCGENGTLLAFSDAAVCISPDSEELADIAISTCDTVKTLLGWEPKCALLSYSTDGSAESPMVDKVRNAVRIANKKCPSYAIDGEFQLDTAINPKVAEKKVRRKSRVAGKANIIIYPDINAGNIGVKLVQLFAHADAYGPMLQGFAKPVSDCSRSAPVSELVGNIIMLAVRTKQAKE